MTKDYRVFNDQLDYIECLNYDLEGDLLPRDIKDFPAYAVYDDFMEQWRAVDYKTFIQYLKTMREELNALLEDVERFLQDEDD